jgi:hypothetical protein
MLTKIKTTKSFLRPDSHKMAFFAFFGNYFAKVKNGHLFMSIFGIRVILMVIFSKK